MALALANPLTSQGSKAFPGSLGVSERFSLDPNLRITGEITKPRIHPLLKGSGRGRGLNPQHRIGEDKLNPFTFSVTWWAVTCFPAAVGVEMLADF